MKSDNQSHKESKMANDFLEWYSRHESYVEYFTDLKTTGGDPFDSAGYINNNLFLIEFKDKISTGIILNENSKGSSIERKVTQVLYQVYNEIDCDIYNSIKPYYDRSHIPTLLIVANSISSNALNALEKLFEKKSIEWRFNYKVIQWTNSPVTLLEKTTYLTSELLNNEIKIPVLLSTVVKRKNILDLKKIKKVLDYGNYENFEKIHKLLTINCSTKFQAKNINYMFSNTTSAMIGIWPCFSNAKEGLRISIAIDKITNKVSSLDEIGIERSTEKLGFLGWNGYLKNVNLFLSFIQNNC